MTKFIKNVNHWLTEKGIKQTYISMQSGIDAKKLSRLLTGVQDITATDMEKIASALGKDISFFLQEELTASPIVPEFPFHPAAYSEAVEKPLEIFTSYLVEFLQNVDEILSAKSILCPPTGGSL